MSGKRRNIIRAVAIAAALSVLLLVVFNAKLRAWWYYRALQRDILAIVEEQGRAPGPPETGLVDSLLAGMGVQPHFTTPWERMSGHLDGLVASGEAVKREYRLKHLAKFSAEPHHLGGVPSSQGLNSIMVIGQSSHDPSSQAAFTVWCWKKDAAAWDNFVAEHDVPDYRERFMESSPKLRIQSPEPQGEPS